MQKVFKYNELYDCYQSLLTEKERKYFEDYYKEDLSLQEIAENCEVSRNAVHKMIQNVEKKLDYYESSLQLNERNMMLSKALELEQLDEVKKYIKSSLDI